MAVGNNVHQAVLSGLIPRLMMETESPEAIVEELFIRCLSRTPTVKEMATMKNLIGEDHDQKEPYEDILWALINSTEFMTNH